VRELDVSIVVIGQGDTFLLQKRGDDPQIGAAGLIGAFGGKIEVDETPRAAGCRELSEETNLTPQEDQLRELGKYAVVSDHKLEDVHVNISAFQYDIDSSIEVAANEGTVVSFTKDEAMNNLEAMTPATRTCFETIIGKEA
jgi:8-oxo-dGTP pyrophosphatase MutT (NUDIX family)